MNAILDFQSDPHTWTQTTHGDLKLVDVQEFDARCEKIFSYSPPGPKMFYYEGRFWRTSPGAISDGDSSGPWREPTEEELASLPKLLRTNA